MKLEIRRITTLLVLLSLMGFSVAQAPKKYVIKVNGLTCPFCAYGLEKKLKKVSGVQSVSINLSKDQVVVVAKAGGTVEEECLRRAVRSAGFTIASLKELEPDAESGGGESR